VETFKLPPHVTCELHAFLSSDGEHDAGFAQLCINMVMTRKEESCTLPKRVKNWSDGGRAHFKNYRQLLFMAHLARRYGTEWWWNFFQSCHGEPLGCLSVPYADIAAIAGKGMHDGAGAWIKSSVARACLSGVGIASVEDFFHYCQRFLNANVSRKNFTSERHFYLITVESAAMYRASMPSKVTGKLRILQTKTGVNSLTY